MDFERISGFCLCEVEAKILLFKRTSEFSHSLFRTDNRRMDVDQRGFAAVQQASPESDLGWAPPRLLNLQTGPECLYEVGNKTTDRAGLA
jgi:hypothetical protein